MAEEETGLASELTKVLKKNEELIGELRKKDRALKKFDGVDLDALQKAAERLEEVEIARQKEVGEYETLYKKEVDKSVELQASLDASGRTNTDLSKRIGIIEVLPTNVNPDLRQVTIEEISKKVTRDAEGNITGDGKPLKDFMKDWAETSFAKAVMMAPDNSGGGAQGNASGSGPDQKVNVFKKGDPAYSLTEQAKIRREDPERAEKLAKLAQGG